MNPIGRRVYPYAPSWKAMVVGFLFFTGGSLVLAVKASGTVNGFRLFRVIEFSSGGATRLYIVASLLCGIFSMLALIGLWKRLSCPQEIVVDDEGLEVPRSLFSRENMRVTYAEIASVTVSEVMGERTLRIGLRNGAKKEIVQNHLPTKEAFTEIAEVLQQRTGLVPPPGAP